MSVPQVAALGTYMGMLQASLSSAGQATLASIQGTLMSNPQAATRALWSLALREIKDPAVLRAVLNAAGPAMGAVGLGYANIQVASVALTGLTVGALVIEVMFWIAVAALVICLVLLILWLLKQLVNFLAAAMSWNPGARNAPPMQTPNWGRLLNVLHEPGMGPIYAIENKSKPTEISM